MFPTIISAYIEGTDWSHWNLNEGETVDFLQVMESGIAFVIGKGTESNYFKDDKWPYYRDGCIAVGLPISMYHFYRFDVDPVVQARFCLSYVGCPFPIIIWNDVETLTARVLGVQKGSDEATYKRAITALAQKVKANQNLEVCVTIAGEQVTVNAFKFLEGIASATTDVLKFMQTIEDESDNKSGMYSAPYFIKSVFGDPASNDFLNFYLWIAHVGVNTPLLQAPWKQFGDFPNNKHVQIHQYTWTKSIPGMPDPTCDGNRLSNLVGGAVTFFMNGGNVQPPTLPDKVYTNVASLNIRRVPTSKDGSATVCGYTVRNQEHHPEELVVNDKGEEWYKVTAYIAKWLTRT